MSEIRGPGDFAYAILAVKFPTCAIYREGWNGKDLKVKAQYPDEHSKMTLPYLYIEYSDGKRCPWLPSQTDLMSDDWYVIQGDL